MFLLLSLFICAVFGQAFQCSFTLKQGKATVKGVLIYDYDNGRIKRTINDNTGFPIVTQFYQYDPNSKVGVFSQTTNNFNSRCSKEVLTGTMQDVDISAAQCEIGNDKYTLTDCQEVGSLSPPDPPAYGKPCASCADQLDIVFVVDTSLSICGAVGALSKAVKDLAASYDYSQVRIGIVRFTWRSWVSSPLNKGTSLRNSITYPDDWPTDCGTLPTCSRPGGKNNCLGTCITCGVRQAVKHLKDQGRAGAGKAIVVLTDGFHNKIYTGDSPADGAHSDYVTKVCSKKAGQTCKDALLVDLDQAKVYATTAFPKIQIFAFGQYVSKRAPEVDSLQRLVTDADNAYVSTEGWKGISAQTSVLAAQVCGGVKKTCTPACGANAFCSLGQCLSLTGTPNAYALQAATDAGTVDDNTNPTTKANTNSNNGATTSQTSSDGVTTTTTITTTSGDDVPAWGVALLALVAVLVVAVILLIGLRLARPGTERV